MNPHMSHGSPSRNGKLPGQDMPTRTVSGQEIPTLRIQAGTPTQPQNVVQNGVAKNQPPPNPAEKTPVLPAISTAQTSPRQAVTASGENGGQKPSAHVFATPQVPAPPTSRMPNHTMPRHIKRDVGNGYGPQCIGYSHGHKNFAHHNNGSSIRLEPLNVSLKLPNSVLQNQSPTPSDVSSIRLTPRNNILSPALSDRNSVMTPRSPKNGFLEPKAIKQEWGAYKVLPGLNSCHQMMDGSMTPVTPHSGYSHYGGSSNSLSPFPNFAELSPAGSNHASPRHSALSIRMAKKRALSVSPLSTEGFDLNQLIRTSPTSLVAYINGSRGSSTNVSPLPAMAGAVTHQLSSSRPGSGNIKKEHHEAPYYEMSNLEHNALDTRAFEQNHMVMPADNVQYAEQNHMFKQEPMDLYTQSATAAMPPTAQRPPVHPPPSYQQAVQNKGEPLPGEDDGEKQHVCRWIDCNQIFNEQDELVRHIEKVHIDQRKGEDFTCFWHSCPRRYKPFNARYKLLIHMRVHSGEKPNKCTFENCNKAFSRLENLKIHLRSHTGERPYICQHLGCNKAFSNSSDRAKHQRTHLDTKPYACTVIGCNKRYTDPSSLRKHHKTHSQKEQQQARKKMRGNKDEVFSNDISLNDCLQICSLRPEGSPMSLNSPHSSHCGSHPGSSSDMYSAITYSSNHSSRSGTANGLSSRPSPASVQGSPMGQHMGMEDCSDARTMNNFNSPMISPGRRPLPPIMSDPKPMSGGAPSPHVSPRQGMPPPAYQQMPAQSMGGYQPPYDMVPQQGMHQFHGNHPEYIQNNMAPVNNKFYEIQLVQQANAEQMNESQINVNYMMMRQPSPRNLMQIPTFEEGLKSITTLSNHSGFSDAQSFDMMYTQSEMDHENNNNNNNQFLQLNHQVDRCNSQLSAV